MNIFSHPINGHVVSWLDNKFPQLKNNSLGTKINWILHDITDFPTCGHCGKKILSDINPTGQYHRFCCRSCLYAHCKELAKTNALKKKIEKLKLMEERKLKKAQAFKNKALVKNKPVINCCVRHLHRMEGYEKSKRTKYERYGDENWNNRPKSVDTYMKHLESDPALLQNKRKKTRLTKLKKYGNETYNNIEQSKRTCFIRYGHENPAHGKNEEKVRITVQKRYGVDYVFQNNEIMANAKSKYLYKNQNFDSSTELFLFIYLELNGIEFQYKPNISYKYIHNGKTHMYHPDFLIGSCVIEIKGDQFFKADGTMYCPFKNKDWTLDEYEEKCKLYEAKHKCMIQNDILILKHNSFCMKYIMKYINRIFGKNYVRQFKNVR